MKVPVLLVAFNRPKTTQKVLEAIAKYYPDELYFSVDGPRPNRPDDVERVSTVRQLVQEGVHARKVVRIFHESNLGCRLGVPTAMKHFFSKVDYGIILEDDCVPCDDFWPFMEFALQHFQYDFRIGCISGNNLLPFKNLSTSFYYSHLSLTWGWGTWRRSWQGYRLDVEDNEEILYFVLNHIFPETKYLQDWWVDHIKEAGHGHSSVWDYQWTYSLWKEGQVSIIPSQNLVVNIGFDAEATHTVSTDFPGANLTYGSLKPPYVFPPTRAVAVDLDRIVLQTHFKIEKPKPETITKKIKRLIKRILGWNVPRT